MNGPLPPLATILPPGEEALDVRFEVPTHGWVLLHCPQLSPQWTIQCSEVHDPFPRFITWLERIVDRLPAAAWQVEEEGSTSHFVFLGAGGFLGDDIPQLIYSWTAADEIRTLTARPIGRRAVVSAFYTAFRHMVALPDYDFSHWEGMPDDVDRESIPEEEYDRSFETNPYSGAVLRTLRSAKIEAFLASERDEFEDYSVRD